MLAIVMNNYAWLKVGVVFVIYHACYHPALKLKFMNTWTHILVSVLQHFVSVLPCDHDTFPHPQYLLLGGLGVYVLLHRE